MVDCEDAAIASGKLQEDQRLSCKMRESWASGDFWTIYAARKNFAFDCVYWEKLDSRYFGPDGRNTPPEDTWMNRVGLLDQQTCVDMEPFVDKKVAEMETRELAWDPDEYTLKQQAAMP
ncbi:hypothetical protein QQS21_009985 [Conoideocrella luteorostrata]|uniref:Uncharacterized protein n=1 Tax=Conoideocrella luteorostrata TaxID=1105319 RepID=A0AAJ0CIL3_9HYPO|nr:hypothetical protein QQS21_009985 [Conoideocrella luteorostrata]